MLTLLPVLSAIQMRKMSLKSQTYVEHLRNPLPKSNGYRMNSHRIRNKMELWTEDRLVTKVVDILIFKWITKGVVLVLLVFPSENVISIIMKKNYKMNKCMGCFSHGCWGAALLPEEGWILLMKLHHFPDSAYVGIVWRAWWICNTRGLTICPIQDLQGINHTNDLRMRSLEGVAGLLLVCRWSVLWIRCKTRSIC